MIPTLKGHKAQKFLYNVSQLYVEKEQESNEQRFAPGAEFVSSEVEREKAKDDAENILTFRKICDAFVKESGAFIENGITLEIVRQILNNVLAEQLAIIGSQQITPEEQTKKQAKIIMQHAAATNEIWNEFQQQLSPAQRDGCMQSTTHVIKNARLDLGAFLKNPGHD